MATALLRPIRRKQVVLADTQQGFVHTCGADHLTGISSANHTARLINVSDLAAPFQLSRQTIHDYVTVLERIFLLERLAPWHNNRLSRLVKASKLHMGDTGLACALMGIDAATLLKERERLGPLLETFVLQELRRQASWRPDPIEFFHYRDRDDFEVDIVLGSDRE